MFKTQPRIFFIHSKLLRALGGPAKTTDSHDFVIRIKPLDLLSPPMFKRRVLLVDDNPTIRQSVRPLFDSHPSFLVCGEASHGRDAVEQAPILRPDLIILDLSTPVMNGLEAAPLLLKILPVVWIILFTGHDGAEVQSLSRAAGIHAVVAKVTPRLISSRKPKG